MSLASRGGDPGGGLGAGSGRPSGGLSTYDVAATVAALPEYWHGVVSRFGERIEKPSTRNDYTRFAKQFIAWCYLRGYKIAELPRDAPFKYYEERGWVGKSASYGNVVTSGLRAFIAWSQQEGPNGPGVPELDFPASIRPPKRVRRIEGEEDMPETNSSDPNASTVSPDPIPSLDAAPPVVPPSAPAAAPSVMAAVAAPPAAQAPAALAYTPGVSERPMARQHVTNRRQTQVKDPLGALMPPGGFIQLERVSDGTDGLSPGQRMDIGRYRINDIQGYNDIGRYVHEQVHPYFDPPLARAPIVTYVATRFDADERKVGAPNEIRVPNSVATAQARGAQTSAPIGSDVRRLRAPLDSWGLSDVERGGSTGNPQVDVVMQTVLGQLNRYNEWQMQQNERYERALEDARSNGRGDNSLALSLMMQRDARPPVDINALMDSAVAKIQSIVKDSRPAPAPYIPPPVSKDDTVVTGKLIDALTVRDTQPKADPLAMAERLVGMMKPAVDPMVALLQDQNRRLETTLSDLAKKIDDQKKDVNADGPEAWFKRQMMFEEMMDRRMARQGGGGADLLTIINTVAEKLPSALKELRLGGALAPIEARARPAAPGPQPQQAPPQQQQSPQPSPLMVESFGDIAAAFDGKSDQGVLTGVLKLIMSIAQAPAPWPTVLPELDANIRAVVTADELQFVVQRLFIVCAQDGLARSRPGLIRFVADVLAWNFPALCERLQHPVRELPGYAAPVVPPVAETPVAPAPSVPEAQAAAPAQAPAQPEAPPPVAPPQQEQGEESDDEEDDEDEEAEDEEDDGESQQPETDGALGHVPKSKVAANG